MQDNAQHDQEQQDETYYPVLKVGPTDFEDEYQGNDFLDEEQRAEQRQRLEFVRHMTTEQWQHLPDTASEILWDSDRWHYSMKIALTEEMEYAHAVSDHQVMQEGAR